MFNNEPANHQAIQIPQSITFLSIIFLILVSYYSFTYNNNPATPFVTVTDVQIPDYTISTVSATPTSTVSFTFTFVAAVKNPSSYALSYSRTSSSLYYDGQVVGHMFIPGKRVAAGMENEMEVSMFSKSVPLSFLRFVPAKGEGKGKLKPEIDLELKMKLVGKFTVFWVFTREIVFLVQCLVTVDAFDGSLLVNHC